MDGVGAGRASARELQPFLKWAGGKRWFVYSFGELLPKTFSRYLEPFLGSGAVFFHLRPRQALLSDSNSELVETYCAIRDDHESVKKELSRHQRLHSSEHYYQVRSTRPRKPHTRAARFIYLNRTCWNGLYRVNRSGEFNVPIGNKTSVMQDTDAFSAWSEALKEVQLACADFELAINQAGPGDFVFCDPPYTVSHNRNGFLKYNQNIFSWNDQIRLKLALQRLDQRGGKFAMTNAMHRSLVELYSEFEQIELHRPSIISGAVKGRKQTSELFVRNF